MTTRRNQLLAAGGAVVVLAVGAFFLLGNRDAPGLGVLGPRTCPITGIEPGSEARIDRPAVAVKVENNPVAYPLSGLEKADVVYEELVEGGITRFMAIYHCGDAAKVGPVRSARVVDPAIMIPYTRILAAAGGNNIVRKELKEADIVVIDESSAGEAVRRIPREGLTSDHTLYGDTRKLREVGRKRFADAPSDEIFSFGNLEQKAPRASSVSINFAGATEVGYEWKEGRWYRTDGGEPLLTESGDQMAADNVIVEEHIVNLSKEIVDTAGNPSVEIADQTGSGRATLFRDGRVIRGTWVRDSIEDPVSFQTRSGDEMVLKPGTTWIELVPNQKGEVKGSFSYDR